MEQYTHENLTPHIGESVQVTDEQGKQCNLVITEVNKGSLDGDKWEAFSVIYSGDKNIQISQGTYTFQHSCFGEKQLFLSPNSDTEYETVVTRNRES